MVVRSLSVLIIMILRTIVYPTELWKCESKLCVECRYQAHKQDKYSTSAFLDNRKDGKEGGRVLKDMSSLRKFNIEVQI